MAGLFAPYCLVQILGSITAIVEQREEIDEILARERIIERELAAAELQKYLTHPNILVISGIRRSGKSILSLYLFSF